MKKILYVEDDVLIARLYSQKLASAGFEVVVAEDGLAAVQRLREFTPDLVVLDLLMPKLTGVDVLKFMRQQPALKDIRIIVFSNSFLSNLIEQVASIGVEEALIKASVTPAKLVDVINKTLANPPRSFLTAETLEAHLSEGGAVPPGAASCPPPAASVPPPGPPRPVSPSAPAPVVPDFEKSAQKEFQERSPNILRNVRQMCVELLDSSDTPVEARKLQDLRRKIGFVSQTLGMMGRHRLAQLCSALEALLFEMEEKPGNLTDSIRHTIAATVSLLFERFDQPGDAAAEKQVAGQKVLVVDDDAISSRAVVLALARAQLSAVAINDPFDGLKKLQENAYALVLLDINMPGLDGLALCDQMRGLPLHKKTPVIFVTSQADFKTRARSMLSGGNDLIAKPILPTELCIKVMSHLIKAG
ncbi:MAG: response regulator [Verrucomicrobiota bacterium]